MNWAPLFAQVMTALLPFMTQLLKDLIDQQERPGLYATPLTDEAIVARFKAILESQARDDHAAPDDPRVRA